MITRLRWRRLPPRVLAIRCRRCEAPYVAQTALPGLAGRVEWHPGCRHRWSNAECRLSVSWSHGTDQADWERIPAGLFDRL